MSDGYNASTSVSSFIVDSKELVQGDFKTLNVPFGRSFVYTPQSGITTIRIVSAAVDMATPAVGTIRVDVEGFPLTDKSVIQRVGGNSLVTLAYIPVEFSDRTAVTSPNSQPVVRLYEDVQLLDLVITFNFRALDGNAAERLMSSANIVFVMETDGSGSGSHSMFST